MTKTLILITADDVASFCGAFLLWMMKDQEAEIIPLHDGAETPDTTAWSEVIDAREIDVWNTFDLWSEPAMLRYEWLKYVHDRKFALPSSREVQAGIRAWPLDLSFWFMHAGQGPQEVHSQGTALLRAAKRHLSFEDLTT